ncbi:unnamed protein product [Leptidea sinapis]|uniref:Uncharacterized protein n=1 Tax=Leptidea sinapis TaxID=189913 RepID=A0A5E4PUP8_9NEOP|nr:unnamed protein product [Leptidea sinapis]
MESGRFVVAKNAGCRQACMTLHTTSNTARSFAATGIGNCWPFGKRDWRASREHSPHAALDANPRELHLHLYRSSVKYHPGYLFSVI